MFSMQTGPIYWDQGHVSDNSLLQNHWKFFLSLQKIMDSYFCENNIKKTSSSFYDDREIIVTVIQMNKARMIHKEEFKMLLFSCSIKK